MLWPGLLCLTCLFIKEPRSAGRRMGTFLHGRGLLFAFTLRRVRAEPTVLEMVTQHPGLGPCTALTLRSRSCDSPCCLLHPLACPAAASCAQCLYPAVHSCLQLRLRHQSAGGGGGGGDAGALGSRHPPSGRLSASPAEAHAREQAQARTTFLKD